MPMNNDPVDNLLGNFKEEIDGHVIDKQGFHLDNSQIEAAILSQKTNNAQGEVISTSGPKEEVDGHLVDKQGFHLDHESLFSNFASIIDPKGINKISNKQDNIDLGILQPIFEEIRSIPFSDKYEEEINLIRKAIRTVGKDIKAKKIAANTVKLAKNAQKFYQSDNGMRIVFSVLGNKFSMLAEGEFTGEEAFYLQINGDNLEGIVLRKNNEDFEDVTSEYSIAIKRVS